MDPVTIIPIALRNVQMMRYIATGLHALMCYEWIVQFREEQKLIHNARWTLTKATYLICRYYPLFVWPLFMWCWMLNHTKSSCERYLLPMQVQAVLFHIFPQFVFISRAYSYSGNNRYVLVVLLFPVPGVLYTEIRGFLIDVKPTIIYNWIENSGCMRTWHGRGNVQQSIGWAMIGMLIMDFTSMSVIAFHCIRARHVQGSLGKLFLKQGIVVYATTCFINTSTAISAMRYVPSISHSHLIVGYIIPNILACRLILGLRRQANPTETMLDEHNSQLVREALGRLGIETIRV